MNHTNLTLRMWQYMRVQGLALSTMQEYCKQAAAIEKNHPDFELWGSQQCISYLSGIDDALTRSSHRNVILKVHRDMLGKDIRIPFIKKPVRLQLTYTHEEVKRIFSQIHNAKHYAIAMLLYVEGMRVSEVVNILTADCKPDHILIRATKNGRDYMKHLDASTIQALKSYCDWLRMRRTGLKKYLFEGWDGNQYSRSSIRQIMAGAIEKAGLDKRGSCHVFRRSNATFKIENNWPDVHIAASLNNTVATVRKFYALVRPEFLRTLPKPAV